MGGESICDDAAASPGGAFHLARVGVRVQRPTLHQYAWPHALAGDAEDYYECWVQALETILATKEVFDRRALHASRVSTIANWPSPTLGAARARCAIAASRIGNNPATACRRPHRSLSPPSDRTSPAPPYGALRGGHGKAPIDTGLCTRDPRTVPCRSSHGVTGRFPNRQHRAPAMGCPVRPSRTWPRTSTKATLLYGK